MAGWKELVLDIIRLTDTIQRLNDRAEKLTDQTNDIDKRVVRLETLVEVAKIGRQAGAVQKPFEQIESDPWPGIT